MKPKNDAPFGDYNGTITLRIVHGNVAECRRSLHPGAFRAVCNILCTVERGDHSKATSDTERGNLGDNLAG